jgi:hypothetical protein
MVVSAALIAPAFADPTNDNANEHATSHQTSGNAGTSGDVNSPQPNSNADNNGTGANNGPGPYTSTRDGSASGNGSGNGNATGEPCAGCVGKADNKNPQGQMPGPSDANAGYECDTNHGIAQTNPAHTGCAEVSGETETPPETPPGCVPTAENNFCSEVMGEELTAAPAPATEVLGESIVAGEALPATGIEAREMVIAALVLLLGGVGMIALATRVTNRPTATRSAVS